MASVPAHSADELDSELDAAFENATTPGGDDSVSRPTDPFDATAARELFAGIVSLHSRPVKNFIFELRRGATPKEWVDISRPVVGSILSAAESMEIPEVTRCLADFDESLAMAQQDDSRELAGETRELILSIYDELVEILPDAFALGEDDHRREGIIIHSLLRQVPGVGTVTIERLYEAGLTSLETLFLANAEEMADTSGVPVPLCARICEKIQQHRYRLDANSPEELLDGHRRRLVDLVADLKRHHRAFKTACEADHPDDAIAAQKRGSRSSRQACSLKINVVLAEMGELTVIEEIQKLGFDQRIEKLEIFLARDVGVSEIPFNPETIHPTARPRV